MFFSFAGLDEEVDPKGNALFPSFPPPSVVPVCPVWQFVLCPQAGTPRCRRGTAASRPSCRPRSTATPAATAACYPRERRSSLPTHLLPTCHPPGSTPGTGARNMHLVSYSVVLVSCLRCFGFSKFIFSENFL